MHARYWLTAGAVGLSITLLAGCGGTAGTPVAIGTIPTTSSPVDIGTPAVTSTLGTTVPSDSQPAGGGEAPASALSDSQPAPAGTTVTASPAFSAEPTSSVATTVSAVPDPVTRAVDKTGWYDGFAITVVEATAEPTSGGDVTVKVAMTLKNLGTDPAFPSQPDVTSDGKVVVANFDAPQIPSPGKADGTLTFSFGADDARAATDLNKLLDTVVLTYGTPADNQMVIPLVADSPVVGAEPMALAIVGSLKQDQIVIDIKGGSLVPSYQKGEKGKAELGVQIALSCAAKCSPSGYNTNRNEFSLTGPDGDSVTADDRSLYCCTAVYPGTKDDNARNILTFVVPLPGTGKYTLTYRNPSLTSEGKKPGTFAFSTK